MPCFALALAGCLALIFLVPSIFGSGIPFYLILTVPFFVLAVALIYPVLKAEEEAIKIDQDLHLFVVRMGVLSQAELSAKGMFYILGEMKEYGRLAVEINKVYNLSKSMELNLADACRVVARSTPSIMFADFLNRFAHALEAGENPRVFFTNEQNIVMDQYAIRYETALRVVDVLNEMFVAMVVSIAFIIVLVIILPLITGERLLSNIFAVGIIFTMVEIGFFYLFSAMMPKESIWHTTGIRTEIDRNIERLIILSFGLSIAIGIILWLALKHVDPIYVIGIAILPLLVPGFYAGAEEEKIKRRDDMFPAFLRSLGTAAETKTTVSTEVLRKLRYHDFGPLTPPINNLYKRLSMRIDDIKSWKYFNAETGSDLISKFTDMYVRGSRAGGSPKEVSLIISNNFIRMLQLRKRRYQHASNLIGIMYGVALALTVPMFITIIVSHTMYDLFSQIRYPAGMFENIPILQAYKIYNPIVLTGMSIILTIINAGMCASIIYVFSAGHKTKILTHFVGILWVCIGVYILVNIMMYVLLSGLRV